MQARQTTFSTLLFLVCAVGTHEAAAVDYYVDAERGNDAWTGTAGTPASGNGPWQSVSRIASAALNPGDNVWLRCGQRWGETLVVPASGTQTARISFGAYPAGCATPPTIDGTVSLPAHAWSAAGGAVYRASLPFNAVVNGGLGTSVAGWSWHADSRDATLAFNAACPATTGGCMSFVSGTGAGSSLAISSAFSLTGRARYDAGLQVLLPAGVSARLIVRRNAAPFEALGLALPITGNGAWQSVSTSFLATVNAANARIDIELPGGRRQAYVRGVFLRQRLGPVQDLLINAGVLKPAHHPNVGFAPSKPESIYLKNAVNSDSVNGGSTYLTSGADLALPAGASLAAGLGIRLLPVNWLIDRRTVASVSGNRLLLDRPSSFPVKAGFGYFLTGAPWMLDSAGEWYIDPNTAVVSVWTPDGAAPGARFAVSTLPTGIDMIGRGYVSINGIAVRGTQVAVRATDTTGVQLSGVVVTDSVSRAFDMRRSRAAVLDGVSAARTGNEAVVGSDATGNYADGLRVLNSVFTETGVRVANGKVVGLPDTSWAAVIGGQNAEIRGNIVANAGYSGIKMGNNSVVAGNRVSDTCLTLNDCGGIYLSPRARGIRVEGNLIERSLGSTLGEPDVSVSHASGVYLDSLATLNTISGNQVLDSEFGIFVHDGNSNVLSGNTLFGNRRYQLWFQEQTAYFRTNGDMHGNTVSGNSMFPQVASPAVVQESERADTGDFAQYSRNRYSAILTPRIVSEAWPGGSAAYTLPEWQQGSISNPSSIDQDIDGVAVALMNYASYRVIGTNIVPDLVTGATTGLAGNGRYGWTYWNATAPSGQLYVENVTTGRGLRFVAGGSESLLSSPNFSVVKDQWYRVSFDSSTGVDGQTFGVLVRCGGGGTATYEALMPTQEAFQGTTAMKRRQFVFKATKTVTVNDPLTRELGARVDFQRIQSGQTIRVANLEIVPISPVEASLRTEALVNRAMTGTSALDCPTRATQPELCSRFVRFSDGQPVLWPYGVSALKIEPIYTIDPLLVDADGDGISNPQDSCSATPSGAGSNARGCGIGQ